MKLRHAAKCKTARRLATERGEKTVLPINMDTNGAEFMFFETIRAVFLRAVLRKECVGTKSDTLLPGSQ